MLPLTLKCVTAISCFLLVTIVAIETNVGNVDMDMLCWLIVPPCRSSKITAQKEDLSTVVLRLARGISIMSSLHLPNVLSWPFIVSIIVKCTFTWFS